MAVVRRGRRTGGPHGIGGSSILIVAVLGHALIPEKEEGVGISWGGTQRDSNAVSTAKIRTGALVVTLLMSVGALTLVWIAFGAYASGISRVNDDPPDLMCNCQGASNLTLCHDARSAVWDAVASNGGGGAWVALGTGVLMSTFIAILVLAAYKNGNGERVFIKVKFVRYSLILLAGTSLATIGYATGAMFGAPMHDLTDACCPMLPSSCVSLDNYTSGVLLVLASILWGCAQVSVVAPTYVSS